MEKLIKKYIAKLEKVCSKGSAFQREIEIEKILREVINKANGK